MAYDKNLHEKLFDSMVEYERFYLYLQHASMYTFVHLEAVHWDKLEQSLLEDGEPKARSGLKRV